MAQFLGVIKFFCLLSLLGTASAHAETTSKKKVTSSSPTVGNQIGTASWYGGRHIGRLTASGERYHRKDVTAAHRSLPFNTQVLVTNLKNGKTVIVRINDRGPFIKGRIIDLSYEAAKRIDLINPGLAKVHLQVLLPLCTNCNVYASN